MFVQVYQFSAPHSFRSYPMPTASFQSPSGNLQNRDLVSFSNRYPMAMMMNALEQMLSLFQGRTALPMTRPVSSPTRHFSPNRCFFSPRIPSRRSAPTPVCKTPQGQQGVSLKAQRQSNSVSCGQSSVAMAVNALTGKNLTDRTINSRYGFGLLHALNSESRSAGYQWRDGGNFKHKSWPLLEKKLNREKTPVLIGLNGPEFSPSGRGHIVTLLGIEGDKVRYADPADGKIKTTTRRAIESAPSHPDGKFFFYASKRTRA